MNINVNDNVFNLIYFIVTANEDISSVITIGVCSLFILFMIFYFAHFASELWVNDGEVNRSELEDIV